MIHPIAEKLASGWLSHFWAADHEIKWTHAEVEAELWLSPNTLLLGRIDALGDSGGPFFGEWKSANPREKNTWKQVWRMNPQSLCYGLLAQTIVPDCKRFTVRKAFKSETPTYDHEWYTYDQAELDQWKLELLRIADEIRAYRASGAANWPTNWDHCYKWSTKYPCVFHDNCMKRKFEEAPEGTLTRISHLDSERRLYDDVRTMEAIRDAVGDIVILDATRVKEFLSCRESFRRQYESNVVAEPGEALIIGIGLHDYLGAYYTKLIKGRLSMAEIESSAAIMPALDGTIAQSAQGDFGRYRIKVRDFDAAGKVDNFEVALPVDEHWGNVMLRAAILKRTTWKTFEIPTIIHAVVYADQMGLDIMAGDVYMASEGRLSTTAGAKIRHAMNTGRIQGYTVEITDGPEKEFKYTVRSQPEAIKLPNYHCKVTVEVVGWKAPMIYETDLSEWFEGRNPNWRQRTKYMLRRNALSKAFEEVAPMGVEADEAPPAVNEAIFSGSLGQAQSKLTAREEEYAKVAEAKP